MPKEQGCIRSLREVVRPDGQPVTFTYDALGRRISKTFQGITTRWLWDGNAPLHEWREDVTAPLPDKNEITTWVFDEGTFRPAAKLVGDKAYSIITDYLGTPAEMYDAEGIRTWQAEFDIYGKIRTFAGRSLNGILRSATKGSMRMRRQVCTIIVSATTQPMKGYVYIARPDRVGW